VGIHLGAGWRLVHLTDRVIELRKDDALYRSFTGRDGYVRLRAEPGMDRNGLLDQAMTVARKNDELLALRYGKKIVPRLAQGEALGRRVSLEQHRGLQRRFAPAFATKDQEPEQKVCRP